MENEEKPKLVYEEKFTCPYCNKRAIIKKTKKIVTPAEAAEYEEKITVRKDMQTTLPDISEDKKKKKK